MNAIIKLIAADNYIICNKSIAKVVGVNAAIVMGELSSVAALTKNDEFFCLKSKIMRDTTLGDLAVTTAIKTLKDCGLINIVKKGVPAKNYYTINGQKVMEILSKDDTDTDDVDEPEEIEVKQKDIKKKNVKKFIKPSVEEIREYCKQNNYNINPESFYDYYESKGWMVGKSPMKDWKASVRTWVRNQKPSSYFNRGSPQQIDEKQKYEEMLERVARR